MPDAAEAAVHVWHHGPAPQGVLAATRRLARAEGVCHVAVMPDAPISADVCVGTVVATRGTLYPNAVGGDIGCGMAAIAFDARADLVERAEEAARVLSALIGAIPFVRHARCEDRLPERLRDWELSDGRLESMKREAERQLGTLGSGNHFVALQEAEDGRLWLMVHSGSRGIGQAIRDHHLERCRSGASGLRFLDADSAAGRAYTNDVAWSLAYAEASRCAMVQVVVEALERLFGVRADAATAIACHHNHVREEAHGAETLWVHRKGAIGAAEGEPGLVPGSMGTASFHVLGRGCAESLRSSAHGAGRVISRSEARRRVTVAALARETRGVWFDHRLAAHLRDEAPSAYK